MATRLYLPSTGAPPVSPTFSTSWNVSTGMERLTAVRTRVASAMANKDAYADSTATARFIGRLQYVYGPLTTQTISGTVKGQIRCYENSTSYNGTVAVHIRTMYYDGSNWQVRGTNLAVSASDNTAAAPPEFTTTLTNRRLQDVNEATTLTLTNVNAQQGDYLVIELGVREVGSTTTRYGRLSVGDNSATDLAEDNTTTAANNPWIEFSADILKSVPLSLSGASISSGSLSLTVQVPTVPVSNTLSGVSQSNSTLHIVNTRLSSLTGASTSSSVLRLIRGVSASLDGLSVSTSTLSSHLSETITPLLNTLSGVVRSSAIFNAVVTRTPIKPDPVVKSTPPTVLTVVRRVGGLIFPRPDEDKPRRVVRRWPGKK